MIWAVLLSVILVVVNARSGVDLSVVTDESTWNCLVQQHNITFAIIRAYRSVGAIDVNSANTITLAAKAGIKDVDAYLFPCISTSPYSLSHNITCLSAEEQVADTVNFLTTAGSMSYVSRLWIDIEDETPSKYFDPDAEVNQKFLEAMVQAIEKLSIKVGIYTTKTYWTNIMGSNPGYGQYPLWYPRYDNVNSFDFFAPFAGWSELSIKQTAGDAPLCSLSQVDTDYMLN